MAYFEHRQAGRDVFSGHVQRFGHGTHPVVEANVGVPQWIPQVFGDLADDVLGQVVVQQHQVEVGVRQQFPAAQPPGGNDGEAAGFGDPDLGGFGG